jgi:hypothetical protein
MRKRSSSALPDRAAEVVSWRWNTPRILLESPERLARVEDPLTRTPRVAFGVAGTTGSAPEEFQPQRPRTLPAHVLPRHCASTARACGRPEGRSS